MQTARCLPESSLEDFVLGRMADGPGNALLKHLESCQRCQQALDRVAESTSDDLIAALQGEDAAVNEFESEAALAAALSEIKSPVRLPNSTSAEPDQGQTLRDYRLLDKLGEGGMGAVYKAVHTKLDKTVALKLLSPARIRDEHAVERFLREMKAVGRLRHPNIVEASDAGEAEGRHYLVMEYVDGVSLSALVDRTGPLPIAEACELVRQAANGLEYAHQNGMVHRDVKPSNIMVTADGHVKVLDLGLALLHGQPLEADRNSHDTADSSNSQLTSVGQLMGTLDYMAPEQCDDSHQVDIRADIYSLGATLYKLLAGRAPYEEDRFDTPIKKMMALTHEAPPPIRTLRPDVPELLGQVMNRMLAKQPQQRFDAPARVATALTPFAETADVPGWLAGAFDSDLADLRPDSLLSFDSAETLMSDSQKSTEEQFDPYHVWLSIAPAEQPPHHYRLLGLHPFESDLRVIESAADRQMSHVRTFQSGKFSKVSQKLLNEISSAKLCLLNEAKKRAYDKKLQTELAEKENRNTSAAQPTKASAAKPATKPTAKPAPKMAKPSAAQPDAAGANGARLENANSSASANTQSDKSPNWAIIASVAAIAAVLLIVIVAVVKMNNDSPPIARVPMPPPPSSPENPRSSGPANDKGAETPKHVEPPPPPATIPSTGADTKTPNGQGSTSVEPVIEPVPIENPPVFIASEPPAETVVPTAITQDDSNGPPQTVETNTTTEPVGSPAETGKLPIPDAAQIKAAEQLARELFAEDIKEAKTPEEESKLGAKWLDAATKSQGKPAERFALMKMAYERAVSAGNLELVAKSVAALDGAFQVDALLLRASAYSEVSRQRMPPEASRALVVAMLDLMADAELAERYDDIVGPLRTLAGTTARKTNNDAEFRKHVIELLKQSREREEQFDEVRQAIEKLAGDDNDAAAHEVLGKYLCFVKREWHDGLQHLTQGIDAELKKLATDDRSAPEASDAQIALADAWLDRSRNEKDQAKSATEARAKFWYERALPQTTGLLHAKLEQTLEQLAGVDTAAKDAAAGDAPKDEPEEVTAGAISFVPRVTLKAHSQAINSLAFGPGGMLVSSDHNVVLAWNPKNWSKTVITDSAAHPPWITSFALSPDGKKLVSGGGSSNSPINFWNMETLKLENEFTRRHTLILRICPQGRTLAASIPRYGVALWDGKTGEQLPEIEARYAEIRAIAFSPNGEFVASAGFNGRVNINVVATGKLVASMHAGHLIHLFCLAWSPGGKLIASSGKDPDIQLWDAQTKKWLGKLEGHTDTVLAAEFAPVTAPAAFLATAGDDHTIRIWNTATGKTVVALPGHQGGVTTLAFSHEGNALASGDSQGVIRVWEIRKNSSRGKDR